MTKKIRQKQYSEKNMTPEQRKFWERIRNAETVDEKLDILFEKDEDDTPV